MFTGIKDFIGVSVKHTMKKKTITYDRKGNTISKKILLFDNVTDMRILSNGIAWRIIELLSIKAMYPAQIAKELKLFEQTVYYYIKKLLKIGAIEQVGTSLIRGGTARLYSTTSTSFGIEIEGEGEELETSKYIQKQNRKYLD